jgi:hypothetical protein
MALRNRSLMPRRTTAWSSTSPICASVGLFTLRSYTTVASLLFLGPQQIKR